MMNGSEDLAKLASRVTVIECSLHELLVRRRSASADALPEIDSAIRVGFELARRLSRSELGAITAQQLEEQLQQGRVEAAPDDPRTDMGKFVHALDRSLSWRRDEICYLEDGIRKLPRLRVVAAWDDGSFNHFVIHVLAGAHQGFLGYCYEDDPSRWLRRVTGVEAQEVNVLGEQWSYGENLVPKIEGTAEAEILWGPWSPIDLCLRTWESCVRWI